MHQVEQEEEQEPSVTGKRPALVQGDCFTLTIVATNPALYPSPHLPEF